VTNRSSHTHNPPGRADRRPGLTPVVAAILLASLSPGIAAAQTEAGSPPVAAPDRIAVLPLDVQGDIPASRPALEAAVLRGLTVAAAPSLPAGEAEARLRTTGARVTCEESDCWTALGRAMESRYLIAGKVERKNTMFEVAFEVYDSRSGRMLARDSNKCEADDCSVAELCRMTVRELARQTLSQLDEPAAAEPAPVSAGTPPAAQVASSPRAARDRAAAGNNRKWWAAGALAGGALSVAAGALLVRYHYSCAEWIPATGECRRLHGSPLNEALIGGLAAGAVGVAALTTGVVLLVTGGGSSPRRASDGLTLSLGLQSLVLSGRF
jgi:hypothetical protein